MTGSQPSTVAAHAPISDSIDSLRAFYVEERDKHLGQLMAINGRLAFAALAGVFALAVGIEDARARLLLTEIPWWCSMPFGVGASLLVAAIWSFSAFHSRQIRELQHRIVRSQALDDDIVRVIPEVRRPYPFLCVFFGLGLMLLAVMLQLIRAASNG